MIGQRRLAGAMALAAALGLPALAAGDVISFDFASLGVENTPLPHSVTVNGVTATGWYRPSLPRTTGTGRFMPADLWLRNVTGDHGLGVCSEGVAACSREGGNTNEVSQLVNMEALLLTRPDGTRFDSVLLSSLDTNGSGPAVEFGRVYWADAVDFTADGADFDVLFARGAQSMAFTGRDFATDPDPGSEVEGSLFALGLGRMAAWRADAKYLLFVPDGVQGDDNDFLVWKGTIETDVPEPSTLALIGLALGCAIRRLRRR